MLRKAVVFLVLFVSFSLVYGSATYYFLSQRALQPFMGFAVYSETGSLSRYVNGSSLSVPFNQTVHWNLQVTNMMGSVQFARVVARLGNSSTTSPTASRPGDAPVVGVLERFVATGATENMNFNWTILSTNKVGQQVSVRLRVNGGSPVSPPVSASRLGQDFRLLFELWMYELSSDTFQYGWRGSSSRVGTWLQVWFNAP
ncbi:hypothetical protein E6H36_06865 [Candidatus Bathyarchaeota archaeon]|nr:MAG: hypothetical protein E6H36_06865 [Candidatus Bathyarchaeota archaeon]TMI30349.1 MAG: hypothetical protein E6H29_08355 [Candidatus Bathyarchaeota archaeon]